MSHQEIQRWAKYLAMEPDNSVELQLALIAQVANNAMGGKLTLEDALITRQKPEKGVKFADENTVKAIFGAISIKRDS